MLWLTFNRPEAGNAATAEMREAIARCMDDASGDPEVRAVVIGAVGDRHFCTGADLQRQPRTPARPVGAPEQITGDLSRLLRQGWHRTIASIMDCEKPVIASINGTAAGAGMHVALACDLVLMAAEAKFISVFVRRGIIPDAGGPYLLARLIGPQRAKELFFFGDDVPAEDAFRIGLVNRVVPRDGLAALTAEWAQKLAAGPTRAIALTKWLTNRALDHDRSSAFWDEGFAQELANGTADFREGLAAFAERRQPRFSGW